MTSGCILRNVVLRFVMLYVCVLCCVCYAVCVCAVVVCASCVVWLLCLSLGWCGGGGSMHV